VAAPSAPKTGYLFTDRRDGKHKHSAHSPTFTDHGAKYHTVAADTTTVFSRSAPRDFSPSQSYQNHANQKKNIYNQLLQHTTTKNFALTSTGNNYVVFKMTS
jgi:hypothetical protein